MRKSGGRPRVRPYVWKDGDQRTPGAMVDVPGIGAGRLIFLAADDLARVADRLIDILEEIEDGAGDATGRT